jgi:hypothetical protein
MTDISFANDGGSFSTCSLTGTLPSGLSFDSTTCKITGTPSVSQAATTYTVTVNNPDGSNTESFSLTVVGYQISIAKTTDGVEGGANAVFTVSVSPSNSSGSAITGDIAYSGSATNGTDYATGATRFSIASGSSDVIITLNITDDSSDESTETIIATISGASVGTIGTSNDTANITDDDTIPTLNTTILTGSGNTNAVIKLTFSAALDTGSVPAASAFTVASNANPAASGETNDPGVTAVSITGSVVTLTLDRPVVGDTVLSSGSGEETIAVNYTVPGSNPIKEGGDGEASAAAVSSGSVANNATTDSCDSCSMVLECPF